MKHSFSVSAQNSLHPDISSFASLEMSIVSVIAAIYDLHSKMPFKETAEEPGKENEEKPDTAWKCNWDIRNLLSHIICLSNCDAKNVALHKLQLYHQS